MSAPINDGGLAFPASPCVGPNNDLYRPADIGQAGMTLRDYFAGKALQGMLACPTPTAQWEALAASVGRGTDEVIALRSYQLADAMIAARDGKEAQS